MSTFAELGISKALLEALPESDFLPPIALQIASVPVLRKGTNAVLRASAGAGVTTTIALGILDIVDPEANGPRLLVLVPTADAVEREIVGLAHFAAYKELDVRAIAPHGSDHVVSEPVVVATPSEALGAVKQSRLKLDDLKTLVIRDFAISASLGDAEILDTLVSLVPADAQRVVFTPEWNDAVEDFASRAVRRAFRFPARIEGKPSSGKLKLTSAVVTSDEDKLGRIADLLKSGTRAVVYTAGDDRSAELADGLAIYGFAVGGADDEDAEVVVAALGAELGDDPMETGDRYVVSFDVPLEAAQLRARHGSGGIVFVEPREVAHLKAIAEGITLVTAAPRPLQLGQVERFRADIKAVIDGGSNDAELLLLAPLFEANDPAVVAAALAAMLRRTATPPVIEQQAHEALVKTTIAPSPVEVRAERAERAVRRPAESGPARLFISVGTVDRALPKDIVGAIAGEAKLKGADIGRVDMRDTFTTVEVPRERADHVIRTMNGATIKGRSVRVDYDRSDGRPAERSDRPTGNRAPPRRDDRDARRPSFGSGERPARGPARPRADDRGARGPARPRFDDKGDKGPARPRFDDRGAKGPPRARKEDRSERPAYPRGKPATGRPSRPASPSRAPGVKPRSPGTRPRRNDGD